MVLLASVFIGWLIGGVKTRVWVDGCPDVAPPEAPEWWSNFYLYIFAPILVLICVYGGIMAGRYVLKQLSSKNMPNKVINLDAQ